MRFYNVAGVCSLYYCMLQVCCEILIVWAWRVIGWEQLPVNRRYGIAWKCHQECHEMSGTIVLRRVTDGTSVAGSGLG